MPEVQPTNNPVPSDHPADARDNFKILDEFVNSRGILTSPSRTGRQILTLTRYNELVQPNIDGAEAAAEAAAISASAAEAAASGLDYQGLWPDTGGSANKGETYQTQTGGTPTGQYFTALQNTTVNPVGDNVNWREVISIRALIDYTDIVYKASGGNSAVENMIAGDPVSANVGDLCSVAGMLFRRTSKASSDITDFSPVGPVDISAFTLNDALAVTNQTLRVINAIEITPNGGAIYCSEERTLLVSKPVGYRTDIYGVDGRNNGGLVWNGAQPCLPIIEKERVEIDFSNVEFVVEAMGQGGIDWYKCVDTTTIHAGTWIPKFARNNSNRSLWFPPIDGNSGFAEKGTATYGFNTTTLTPDIGGARNGMFVTSGQTSGGYGGNFPQDDGLTASTWGQWRGGEIGSYGDCLTFIGGKNNKLLDYDVTGFNGSAVAIGILRGVDGTNQGRIDPSSEEFVPVNTEILGGESNYCYTANIQRNRYRGLTIKNTKGYYAGHPDWSISNTITGTTPQVDPGYGIQSGRFSPQFDALIENNEHLYCARKGFDSHNGNFERVYNNRFIGGVWGGQVAIEDTLQDPSQPDNFAQTYSLDMKNNKFEGGWRGLDLANGSFGRGPRESANQWWLKLRVNIEENTIKGPNGWYYNYGHSPFNLVNNEIEFSNRYDIFTPFPTLGTFGFVHGALGTRGPTSNDVITGNKVRNSLKGNFQYSYFWYNVDFATINDNYADITPFSLGDGVEPYTTTDSSAHRAGVATLSSISSGGTFITNTHHKNNYVENVISNTKNYFNNIQSPNYAVNKESLNFSAGWPIGGGGVTRNSRLGFVRFRAGFSVSLTVRISFMTFNGTALSTVSEEHTVMINETGTTITSYENYKNGQAAGSATTFSLGTPSGNVVDLNMEHTSTIPYSTSARNCVIVEWIGGDFYRDEAEL